MTSAATVVETSISNYDLETDGDDVMKPIKNDALLMRLPRAMLRAVEKTLVTSTYRKVDIAGPRLPRPSSGREPRLRVCRKFRRLGERNGHTLEFRR